MTVKQVEKTLSTLDLIIENVKEVATSIKNIVTDPTEASSKDWTNLLKLSVVILLIILPVFGIQLPLLGLIF